MRPINQTAFVKYPAKRASLEFNNILTACLDISELLLSVLPDKDPMKEDIEEKRRAVDLIRPLFHSQPSQPIVRKTFNINTIIINSQKLLHKLIGGNIKLVIIPSLDPVCIPINPEQIEHILFNLAVNARDAMPSGGIFIIETDSIDIKKTSDEMFSSSVPPGEYVKLSVIYSVRDDEGETRSNMNLMHNKRKRYQHSNLGFATIYRTVRRFRGNVRIHTEKGKGTKVEVFFPRKDTSKVNPPKKPWIEYSTKNRSSLIFSGIV